MKKYAVFALALVIACAGCVEISSFLGGGIQGISVTENTQKQGSDILVIENIDTLPRSPVFAGQQFTFYFKIRNVDAVRTAKNVRVEIVDDSIFVPVAGLSECVSGCEIPPMGEKVISADFHAPESGQIAYTQTTKRVSFRVLYDFNTTTLYDVVVIDRDEVLRQQQAGKSLAVNSNRIIGSGPVKIYPSLVGDNFVMESTSRNINFIIRNEGSGILENNAIGMKRMTITFPSSFSPTGAFLKKSVIDEIAATGNAIITGMATGCSELCGDFACDTTGCGAGCGCDCPSECSSGLYCVSYGEIGGICQASPYATTTSVPSSSGLSDGEQCSLHSQCSSGCCIYDTELYYKACQANYYCDSSAVNRPNGAPCSYNSQCSSQCCYNEIGIGQYCQAAYICDSSAVNRPNGAPCSYNSQCASQCCYNEIGIGQYCQATSFCPGVTTTVPGSSKTTTTSGSSRTTTVPRTTTSTAPRVAEKMFTCVNGICYNLKQIDIFGTDSSPLLFSIEGPKEVFEDVYKIYTLTANIIYTYELRGQKDIEIMPIENVPGDEW